MPLRSVHAPDAEPFDRVVKVRFSSRQLEQLDLAVAEFRMSRSWLIREALAEGLPNVVEKVRERLRAGLVPRGAYWRPGTAGPRHGPRSDGPREDRWVVAPQRRGRADRK